MPPIFPTSFLANSLCLAVKALDFPELLGPDHLLRQQDATGSTLEGCWEEAKPQQAQEEWHHVQAPLPFSFKGPFLPKLSQTSLAAPPYGTCFY